MPGPNSVRNRKHPTSNSLPTNPREEAAIEKANRSNIVNCRPKEACENNLKRPRFRNVNINLELAEVLNLHMRILFEIALPP